LSELKSRGHDLMSLARDAVVIRFANLKDEFVSAQQRQQATDAGGTVLGIART